jgi:gliding motility-associated-like protein
VSGVATFSGLSINKVGTGYTLSATSGSLTSTISLGFDITPGVAAQLLFSQQPGNGVAGSALSTQPKVTVQDAYGNTVSGDNSSVVTLAIGTNPNSGVLSGTLTSTVVSGVATFSGLSINKVGTGYTLSATSGSLTSTISLGFDITPGVDQNSPTDILLSRKNIYEKNNIGDTIGIISTRDLDVNDTHIYDLVNNMNYNLDNANFKISGNILYANVVFNAENGKLFKIRIRSQDLSGRSFEKNFEISVSQAPIILGQNSEAYRKSNFSNDFRSTSPMVSKGYSSQLEVIGEEIKSILWEPSTGLTSSTSMMPIFKFGTTIKYNVKVTNIHGSVKYIPFQVNVLDDYYIKATNILTTRKDGINDYFLIENIATYPDNEVIILDRNGRLLKRFLNYNNKWDGMINGNFLQTDTYYYIIKFRSEVKPYSKGFLTIINN